MEVYISSPLEREEYIWISDVCTDGYGGDPDAGGGDCDCVCVGCDE